MLHLPGVSFRNVAMFIILGLQTTYRIRTYVSTMYLRNEFHKPRFNVSLAIAIKPETYKNFRMTAMLLFYI